MQMKSTAIEKISRIWKKNWQLGVLVFPSVLYFIIFNYLPLYGIQIAFKDFRANLGINGSAWKGLMQFDTFIHAYYFRRLITNTLILNLENLIFGFPVPLILAISLNQIGSGRIKHYIQTVIYVPYFISTVVLAGMMYIFLSPSSGIFNLFRTNMGFNTIDYMSMSSAFRPIYIISGIWQGAGYSSILYIATLTGVDPSLYEAADMDGASILQKIRFIDIPSVIPTAVMVFILECGKLVSSNTSKVLVMQTSGNIPTSDIIGVYVYNIGLKSAEFSYTTALGLFTNIINFILILSANTLSKKSAGISMF